jgi:hypothetical protein
MHQKIKLICILSLLVISGCAPRYVAPAKLASTVIDWEKRPRKVDGQYLVNTPNIRMKNPEKYFSAERKAIQERRELAGIKKPDHDELGLALSGGGIRSNAFQLGLMSGLNQIGKLKNVDYISAVSGGSWAAGAYKSTKKDDDGFFNDLNSVATRDDLQNNDLQMHPLFNSYETALKEGLAEKKDFLDVHVGYTVHEAWRKMLKVNVLDGHDPLLEDLNGEKFAKKRPYVIFNATHDGKISLFGSSEDNMIRNFPFELTADYVGTLVDCGNSDYCSYFNKNEFKGVFTPTAHMYIPPLFLSHAMAISGAVAPQKILGANLKLLDWRIDIPDIDKNQELHRGEVVLTDGGHAENLGAFALIERSVPLIVISDAAYDPHNTFGDLNALQHHAEHLLGVGIKKMGEGTDSIIRYVYFSKAKPDKVIGNILYLKASACNTDKFYDYLLENVQTYNLKAYLDTTIKVTKLGFPSDKTFATAYDFRLIFSYYMLGRYYAAKILGPELDKLNPNI